MNDRRTSTHTPITLKAWFAYEGVPEWYSASLILENGAVPYGHCCSHPCFVPGDLWTGRPQRHEQMRAAGVTLDIQNDGEPIHASKLPAEVLAANKSNAAGIKAFYERVFGASATGEGQ